MRFFLIVLVIVALAGIDGLHKAYSQQEPEWIKYFTWEGDIDEMTIFRADKEEVKADYPVGSGFKNAKVIFFAGENPGKECTAKIEVEEGRGNVAIIKQCWQPPESFIKIMIYDKEKGFGHYKFTVYYTERDLTPQERNPYQKLVNKAVYDFDVYQMNKAMSKDNLVDALRWARSAYEIDRLNWDMLNRIGALYYNLKMMDKAEDVFVILRDNGYLTEDNKTRFKEIAPYEYSKLEEKEKEEGKVEEGTEEKEKGEEGQNNENEGQTGQGENNQN
jgi:hypothetical protein